jgi:hypothetical protein
MNFLSNRKSLMKFGKWSLAILSLVVLGFFVVNYVIPTFANPGTITIQGDLPYSASINYYVAAYDATQDSPCDGEADPDETLLAENTTAVDDTTYNHNDYVLTITDYVGATAYLYFCDGVGGVQVLSHSFAVADPNKYVVDLGRTYGTSVYADLNGDRAIVCTELGGTALSSEKTADTEVTGGSYTQYYAINLNSTDYTTTGDAYLLFDTDDDPACTFDGTIEAGKKILLTNSLDNYGVLVNFVPDTKVTGDLHTGVELNNAKFELYDSSSMQIGLATEAFTRAGNPDGDLLDDDYTIYYDKPTGAGDLTLDITTSANGVTKISGIDKTTFDDAVTAGVYDFVEHVTDNGEGVPSDISVIDVTCNVNGAGGPDDEIKANTTLHNTYLYDIYMTKCSAAESILYKKSGSTVYTESGVSMAAEGDDARDLGKVSGNTHADISVGGNDQITVHNDNACSGGANQLSTATVYGSGTYEIYFKDADDDPVYLKANKDGTYATCADAFADADYTATRATTHDFDVEVAGTAHTDLVRVGVDRNNNNIYTGTKEAWTTPDGSGVYYLFVDASDDSGGTDEVLYCINDDVNNDCSDAGDLKLQRTKDLASDKTVNVGRVTGDLHANLQNTHAGDNVAVYSDNACSSLVSSEDVIGAAIGASYTQYYEQNGASNYLKVSDQNADGTYTSCGQVVTWGVYGDPQVDDADVLVAGGVPDDVDSVKIDVNKDGSVLIVGNVVETAVDSYKIYFEGDTDTYLQFYDGAVKVLERTKNLGASDTINVAEFSGSITDSFFNSGGTATVGVYDVYTTSANQYSSTSTITDVGATDDYTVYFEDTGGAAESRDLKFTDDDGYVSWVNDATPSDGDITAGDNADLDLEYKVTGTAPADIDWVIVRDSADGVQPDPFAAAVPAANGTYRMYVADGVGSYILIVGGAQVWDADLPLADGGKMQYGFQKVAGTDVYTFTTAFSVFAADQTHSVVKVSGTVPTTDVTLGQGANDYVFARDGSAEHCNVAVDNTVGESRATIGDDDGTGTYDIYFKASTALYLAFCHHGAAGVDPDYQALSTKSLAAGTDYTLNLAVITGKMDSDFSVGANAEILVYDNFQTDQVGGTVNTAFDGAAILNNEAAGDYYVYFEQSGTAAAKVALTDETTRTEAGDVADVAMKITDHDGYVMGVIGIENAGVAPAPGDVITVDLINDLNGDVPVDVTYVVVQDDTNEYAIATVKAGDGTYRLVAPDDGAGGTDIDYVLEITSDVLNYDTGADQIADDETFYAAKLTGTIDASFVDADTSDLVAVYDTWPATTLLSSTSTVTNGADTYSVYFRDTAAINNVDVKFTDKDGKVSWRLNVDEDNTNGDTADVINEDGPTINDLNLPNVISGTVPIGVYSVRIVNSKPYTLSVGQTTGTTSDTYKIYFDDEAEAAGNTWDVGAYDNGGTKLVYKAKTAANANVNTLDTDTYNYARVLTATALQADIDDADDRYAVCNNIGTTPCETTAAELSSENVFGNSFTAGTAQYFEDDGTVGIVLEIKEETDDYYSYARLDSVDPGDTITVTLDAILSGDTATDPQAVDLVWIDDTGTGNTDDAGGNTVAEYAGDTKGDGTFKIYYNDALNTASVSADTARDVDAVETDGTGVVLTKTKTLANPDTWYVGSAYGATHANLEGGTDTTAACAEDDDYTNGVLCTGASIVSSATVNPSAAGYPGGNDYSVYFEMDAAGGNNWIKVTDAGATAYTMYAIVVTAAGDRDIQTHLDASFSGEIREAFNTDLKINNATIRTYSVESMWTYNTNPEAAEPSNTKIGGFSASAEDGTFQMYGDDTDDVWDVKVSKSGYIRQNAYTNGLAGGGTPNMDDIDIAQAGFNVNLASGVKVIVKEYVSNNFVTDATVRIFRCTGATASTCTEALETCTQPVGNCQRTGSNVAGNGTNGEYHFSGITTGNYVQVRVSRTNYTVAMDPDFANPDNPSYKINETLIQPDGLATSYTYFLSNPKPECTVALTGGVGSYSRAGMLYVDVGQDVNLDVNCGDSVLTVRADLGSIGGTGAQLLTNDGDDTYSYTQTVGAVATGVKAIAVIATDGVNNDTDIVNVYVDNTAPNAVAANDQVDLSTNGVVTWSWTAVTDDDSGLAYYNIQLDDTPACASPLWTRMTATTIFTISNLTDGDTYYFCVQAVDNVGNTQGAYTDLDPDGILIDIAVPAQVALLTPLDGAYVLSTTPTVTWQDVTGEDNYEVQVDDNSDFSSFTDRCILAADTVTTTIGTTCGETALASGTNYYWRVRGIDTDAVNGSWSDVRQFTVDTSIPTFTETTAANFNTRSVLLTGTTDEGATCKFSTTDDAYQDMPYNLGALNSSTFAANYVAAEGVNTLYVRCKDVAGNAAGSSVTVTFTVDSLAPTVTVTGPSGWVGSTSQTLDISTGDATDLCAYSTLDVPYASMSAMSNDGDGSFSWAVTAVEGSNIYFVRCQDSVGNTMNSSSIIFFKIDSIVPVISIQTPTEGAITNSQAVKFTVTDGGIGVDLSTITVTLAGAGVSSFNYATDCTPASDAETIVCSYTDTGIAEATTGLTVNANDLQSNSATAASVSFTYDINAPTGLSVSINDGATYTTTSVVNLTLSATDAYECRFSNDETSWSAYEPYATYKTWVLIAGDGVKTVSYQCRDQAGNAAAAVTDSITLDGTAPTVTINTDYYGPYRTDPGAVVNVDFADAGSLLNNVQYKINASGTWTDIDTGINAATYTTDWAVPWASLLEGVNYIYVRAYDNAGNVYESPEFVEIEKDTTAPGMSIVTPWQDSITGVNVTLAVQTTEYANCKYNLETDTDYGSMTNFDNSGEGYATNIALLTGLTGGRHSVYVRCQDLAGNDVPSSVSVSWIVDTSVPTISQPLVNGVINPFVNSNPTISNVIVVSPSSIITAAQYRIDAEGGAACTATDGAFDETTEQVTCSLAGAWGTLPEGEHTVYINASNSNGPSGFAIATFHKDTKAPTFLMLDPQTGDTVIDTQRPEIFFVIYENATGYGHDTTYGSGINLTTITLMNGSTNMNTLGFNPLDTDICLALSTYVECMFTPNASLADSTLHNISITAYDRAGNSVTQWLNFTIDTTVYVDASLIAVDSVGIADDSYDDGWSFTFNISTGAGGDGVRFRMYDWEDSSGNTIAVFNNTKMVYYDNTSTQRTYWVRNTYDGAQTIYPLFDVDPSVAGTQGNITIYVKIPVGTTSGSYTTSYGVGLYNV